MKLGRLLRMAPSELAGRAVQETWKIAERAGLPGALRRARARMAQGIVRRPTRPRHAGARRPLRGLRSVRVARVPAGPERPSRRLRELDSPQTCERSRTSSQRAERALRGELDLLGYRGLRFGQPVDWHLDAVSGRRAPRVHWSRLDPLDASVVGDSKVVWELNRHQWLVTLAQAYRLTSDARFAQAVVDHITDWIRNNPVGIGINWASSLEVSFRLIAWCWCLALLRDSTAIDPGFLGVLLPAVHAHARHIARYPSYFFSPNTHLTGEALGLVYAGVAFPFLRGAARWRALGARILAREIERQVHPDGVYFEQATCYQRYTAEIYLHYQRLAGVAGLPFTVLMRRRLEALLDFIVAVQRPDGSLPQIGDADGGWLLPLASRAPDDARGVLSTAAVMLSRGDCAWAAGSIAPETVWLLGRDALPAFQALRIAPPEEEPSKVFPQGGYAVMRGGWEPDAHHAILDVGPLGGAPTAGHGHADLLAVQLASFGRPTVIDPGTFVYTADPRWRDYFRGSTAHSTVVVDGQDQAQPAGPFAWKDMPRARLTRWLSTPAYDLAVAEHDAYRRLADPVRHRRSLLFVKPRFWILLDELIGAAEHHVDLRFQLAACRAELDPTSWVRIASPDGTGMLIRTFGSVPLKTALVEGETEPRQGWVSPDYGRLEPAPALLVSATACLPVRMVTLCWPTRDPLGRPPAVEPVLDGRVLVGLRVDGVAIRLDPGSAVQIG